MSKYKHKRDFIGNIFGRLTVIEDLGVINGNTRVLCLCECGKSRECAISSLLSGNTKSCGCIVRSPSTYIRTHGLSSHPLYNVWHCIKNRCYLLSDKCFNSYGGKGVIICNEWKEDFMAFYDWAIDKWKPGLQIDKDILYKEKYGTDTGMIYSPEFCCFVTPLKNSRNKSTSKFIEYNNQRKALPEWCEIYNINYGMIMSRLQRGWGIKEAFETPNTKLVK